jgi:hypothetical protein
MTKYIIYPCTEDIWVKLFKRISSVAKQSGMRVSEIDCVYRSDKMVRCSDKILKKSPVTRRRFSLSCKRMTDYFNWQHVPDVITTIILEKKDETDYQEKNNPAQKRT